MACLLVVLTIRSTADPVSYTKRDLVVTGARLVAAAPRPLEWPADICARGENDRPDASRAHRGARDRRRSTRANGHQATSSSGCARPSGSCQDHRLAGQDRALPRAGLLRDITDTAVLNHVFSVGRITRAELSTLTGISKPTISDAVRRLAARGVLVESGLQTGAARTDCDLLRAGGDLRLGAGHRA